MARGWRSFSDHVRDRFGAGVKVYKITLDAGFTCPNIDGRVARGGCTYCNNRSFSPPTREAWRPLAEQVKTGIDFYRTRYGARHFYCYFQAYTNTYAPVETLRRLYDEALGAAGAAGGEFLGLDIATRPDAVPDDVLKLVASYADRYDVWLEFGVQSVHDATLARTNRGHDFATFEDAVRRARGRGIQIVAHLIHGLPGETAGDMKESARVVAALGLDGVKIHHCYVSRGTPLAAEWRAGRYQPIDLETYLDVLVETLEVFPATTIVHRVVGEFPGDLVVAPDWGIGKRAFLDRLEKELARRGSRQGAKALEAVALSAGRSE